MQKSKVQVKSQNLFQQVYEVVRQIPEGKVMTYGQIALRLRSGSPASQIIISPRTVGWALHANKDGSGVPCYRVVNKEGHLAPGYAFGGPDEQRNRLLAEGVTFINEKCVDLKKHLWKP
jgi:methylated-DNA-protein-cysteine methyltransferase related protein